MIPRTFVSLAVVSILMTAPALHAQPAATVVPPDGRAPVAAVPATPVPQDPLAFAINKFKVVLYGFAELDLIRDSTQFLNETAGNTIVRGNTDATAFAGHHERTMFTARNSRIGLRILAPEVSGVKSSAIFEGDFFGNQPVAYGDSITPITEPPNLVNNRVPSSVNESSTNINGAFRMRHYYVKLETPYLDILAGQYFDLFGWVGAPFMPSTASFLGVVGEIFHRQAQLRLSRRFRSDVFDVELAVAATRPVQRDGGYPDGQGGVRMFVNQWRGVHSQSSGQPVADPLCIGISGVFREFRLNEFTALPPTKYVHKRGWGLAAQALIPIIEATLDDQRNALSLTAEYNVTSGASDYYTGLTGGSTIPNVTDGAGNNVPYAANLDPGIVDYSNASSDFVPIKWQGMVFGAQYHLPIDSGKIWLSALYARVTSSNIGEVALKPAQAYKKSEYFDVSAFLAIAASTQVGLMYQTIKQTYVDDSSSARNNRVQSTLLFFF